MPLSCNTAWLSTLKTIMLNGNTVQPRGMLTYEIPQHTVRVDMRQPVLSLAERGLSYTFMAAEAFWILSGDTTVAGIAPFNKNIAKFSDDGETFYGSYGPRIHAQIDYVVGALLNDPDSRQAGLTIWIQNPKPSRDIPCTVAIWFQVRDNKLNVHVFMRSSDVWLGLPYDIFNFSMLGHAVTTQLRGSLLFAGLEPGILYLTAASSHLYESNREAAIKVIDSVGTAFPQAKTPDRMFKETNFLMGHLNALRTAPHNSPLRWWNV